MAAGENIVTFLAQQMIAAAVPLVMAGIGELVAELAGVINIGIEGLMLTGCIAAYTAASCGYGSIGLCAGILGAMALAAMFATVAVSGRADQIVCGAAINILAVGASGTAWAVFQNWRQKHDMSVSLPHGAGFHKWPLPFLSRTPFFGPALFDQYTLCYVTILLGILVWWLLRYARLGLIIRSLGDFPEACQAAGIRVRAWRWGAVLFAGGCAGAAGAYLSIMRTHSFAADMTGGQGFVVLALVIFGRWNLFGLTAGCLLFGFINALQQVLQTARYTAHNRLLESLQHIPFQWFQMLPYAAALLALAVMAKNRPGPRALGRAWPPETPGE